MITDSFDVKTPPIPKFSSFYGEQKHLVDTCVITFSKEIYDRVLATFDCKKIAVITTCNGDVPIWKFTHDGMETGFYLSMIGSAMAAQCCIESNWLIGSTKYIMFGSAGNLDAEATVMDLSEILGMPDFATPTATRQCPITTRRQQIISKSKITRGSRRYSTG